MGLTMSDDANLPEVIELPELVLLSDEPTPDHDADGLGMRRYAEVIAGAALHTEGPFTIGVYGGWGVGKTSVLRQARSLIEKANPESLCVWFNAWQYDHEAHPLVPLALEIAETVDSRIAAEEEEGKLSRWIRWREIGAALRTLASGLTLKTPILDLSGKDMLVEFDAVTDPNAGAVLQPGVYQKAFALLRKVASIGLEGSEEERRPPIVVFIDDLDRCLPRHALRLLQSIRLVLGQPGFVFVLALDREPIVCHLINEYKRLAMKDPEASGPAYLEKIVQLPLWVPPHQTRFREYIASLLDSDSLKGNEELSEAIGELSDVLAIGTEANPRTLTQLINRLRADQHLLKDVLSEQENGLGLCAVSRLLRQRLDWADYLSLVRDQLVCNELMRQQEDDGEEGKQKWHDLRLKEAEMLDRRDTLRRSISARLDRTPSIEALLGTDIGKEWLTNSKPRLAIELMLAVEAVGPSHDLSADGVGLVEAAIRKCLGLPAGAPIHEENLKAATEIDLRSTAIEDKDIVYLTKLRSLEKLDLQETQVTRAGLRHLQEIATLKELTLSGLNVTNETLEALGNLKSLEKLYVWDAAITDDGLQGLRDLPLLRVIDLSGTPVTGVGLASLKDLPALSSLGLEETQVNDASIEPIKYLTGLTRINLTSTSVSDEGLQHISQLVNLQSLHLRHTRAMDEGLEHLGSLVGLAWLNLANTDITDVGLAYLIQLPSLATLFLTQTLVSDSGVKLLAQVETLRTLSLSGTRVTDAGLENLARMKALEVIYLQGTSTTDSARRALREAIPGLKVVA